MGRELLMIAAISGSLAVAIGAFGAHGLKDHLTEELMAVYQTGVQYHFYHSLALLFVGGFLLQYPQVSLLNWSGYLFIAGLLIFSGSLYMLALTGARGWGAVTPFGGLAFIAGWLMLVLAIYRNIGVSE